MNRRKNPGLSCSFVSLHLAYSKALAAIAAAIGVANEVPEMWTSCPFQKESILEPRVEKLSFGSGQRGGFMRRTPSPFSSVAWMANTPNSQAGHARSPFPPEFEAAAKMSFPPNTSVSIIFLTFGRDTVPRPKER